MKEKLDELLETLEEAERQIADAKERDNNSPDVFDVLNRVAEELRHIKKKLEKLTEIDPRGAERKG